MNYLEWRKQLSAVNAVPFVTAADAAQYVKLPPVVKVTKCPAVFTTTEPVSTNQNSSGDQ